MFVYIQIYYNMLNIKNKNKKKGKYQFTLNLLDV